MNRTTLCLLTFTFLFFSCGQSPVKQETERGPASMDAPSLWGKPVNPEAQDFLDDIENAPSRKYKSSYKESNS